MKCKVIIVLLVLLVCMLVSCAKPTQRTGLASPIEISLDPRWSSLSWSPGPHLLLTSLNIQGPSELYTYNLDELDLSLLIEGSPSEAQRILRARWNTAGELIAYVDSKGVAPIYYP